MKDDIKALVKKLKSAIDDDWPDIMDEGCAEIAEKYAIDSEYVRLEVKNAL